MKPEIWALLTSICWAVGSLLEKKGVRAGGFTPVMGTTIRTVVSLILLGFLSWPFWGEVRQAGLKPILLIAVGGGVLAGALGIVCLYTGLKHGNVSTVMAIAFCMAPVLGAILGVTFLGEKLSFVEIIGIGLCVSGTAMVVYVA